MNNLIRKIGLVVVLSFFRMILFAQASDSTANVSSDFMRSNGKIYVVVAVVVVIVLGIFLYLFRLDRKLTRLEKKG